MGVQTGYNNIHTNQQNCWNWNRITNLKDEPSQKDTGSKTLLDLAEPADIVLDLHTAGVEAVPHLLSCYRKACRGFGHTSLACTWSKPSYSFADTHHQLGKIALTFELSSSRIVRSEWVEERLIYLHVDFWYYAQKRRI